MLSLVVDPTITIPATDMTWSAARAGGPGGQNVNKVSSKVDLRFNLPGCSMLSETVRWRLAYLARNRLDADGWILISSQRTRDQQRNLEDARERLRLLILQALIVPKTRRPTEPSKASQRRRVAEKRQHSEQKKQRARPKSDD